METDQKARDEIAEVRSLLREHSMLCAEKDKSEASLLGQIRAMLTDLRDENEVARTENAAKFARQQDINSELFVKLSRAEAWRDDQMLMRASLTTNGALFAGVLVMFLRLARVI